MPCTISAGTWTLVEAFLALEAGPDGTVAPGATGEAAPFGTFSWPGMAVTKPVGVSSPLKPKGQLTRSIDLLMS